MLAQYRHWWPKDAELNKKKREELKEKMLATVEKHAPGFRDAIDEATIFTRDTYEWERLTGTLDGSTLGWYPDTHTQSLKGMPQQATPIQGLFIAGMFCFPGGGEQAVLMGGITAAQVIASGINMPPKETSEQIV